MTPVTVNLRVQRWAPYLDAPFGIQGLDMSEATFEMQVRAYRDAPGDPLIDLATETAGSEGISCELVTVDDVETSIITVQIDEATINAVLPYPASGVKAGSDVSLFYDLVITGGGLPKTRWFQGSFTIEAGVTQ